MDPNLKKGVKRNGLPQNWNDLMFLCQGENAKLMTKEEDLGIVQATMQVFQLFLSKSFLYLLVSLSQEIEQKQREEEADWLPRNSAAVSVVEILAEALAERQAKSIARKEKIRRLSKSWKVGKESVELRDESFVDSMLTLDSHMSN